MVKGSRIVTGIDVGTSKIATIIASYTEGLPLNILGVCTIPAAGVKGGQIVDINTAVSVINSSLEGAERMAGYSVSKAAISITGKNIESQNLRGVVAVSTPDTGITQSDIARVLDSAKAISLPTAREVLHVLPRSFVVDGQEGIKDPIGMTGVRLEVDTHIITVNTTALNNLIKSIEEVGVDVEHVAFSGLASSFVALTDTEKELGVVLVDIGAGTTDICIYVDGSLSYSSVLGIGARHITNDLAIGLRISFESAEKIKLFLSQKGKAIPRLLGEDKSSKTPDEIDLKGLGINEEITRVSRKTLSEGIIKPRLNEIFTMIGLEIKKSGFGGQTPSGIVLTGGGAQTVGAQEAAKRMLSMPTRIAIPKDITGLIDEIQNPTFSTVVGLAFYTGFEGEVANLPFGMSLPQIPFKIPLKNSFNKALELVKSFLP